MLLPATRRLYISEKTSYKGLFTAMSEGTISGLSWMNCNSCFWLRLRTAVPNQDKKTTTSEVDSWPKMLKQACILISLTTAHTFACESNVFLWLSHTQVLKINPIVGFVANYQHPVLPGCFGGVLLSKTLIGWSLKILF